MNSFELLKDIVENKKSGLLKVEGYILLFKEGKLLESAGKTTNREEAIRDIVDNNYKNAEFQEIDASVLISFNEPLDISDKLVKKKKGREIKLDENLLKKIEEAKLIVPSLKSSVVGKIKGEILAYFGINEDDIENIANNVDAIYEKFQNIEDIILNSRNGATYIRFSNDKYILCDLTSIENIGILKAVISGFLK